jgi:signal transduction histidine kinase
MDKLTNLHILLIEDDEIDRRKVKKLLGSGCVVHEEIGGVDTLRSLESLGPFDLVILDYSLPGVDSLELLKVLVDRGLAVIMLTGMGSESVAVAAMKHGAKDYLVKDEISRDSLNKSISAVLERQRLEREVVERVQELEDFAYAASHDLSAPLCRIHMCIEMISDQNDALSESTRELLEMIDRSSVELMTLISYLLEYSRTGRSTKPLEPVDLNDVVERVVKNLEVKIKEANASVSVATLPVVQGDSVALMQLLQNLIANGVKFRGERDPVITVCSRVDNGIVQVGVSDNGIGIAPEDIDKVFKAFHRGHSKDNYEGSGIGLAICRKVVDQHRGRIWVESELDKGTSFYFTLALADASPS